MSVAGILALPGTPAQTSHACVRGADAVHAAHSLHAARAQADVLLDRMHHDSAPPPTGTEACA